MFTSVRGHYCEVNDDIENGKPFRMRVEASVDGDLTLTRKVDGEDQSVQIPV